MKQIPKFSDYTKVGDKTNETFKINESSNFVKVEDLKIGGKYKTDSGMGGVFTLKYKGKNKKGEHHFENTSPWTEGDKKWDYNLSDENVEKIIIDDNKRNYESKVNEAITLTKEEIIEKFKLIFKLTLNQDGSYDAPSGVDLSEMDLSELPLKFGKVEGNFDCSYNKLTSLEGAPKEVGGDFDCGYNKLTSLKGGPKKVGKNFNCDDNKLTSLDGAPKEVGGNFNCTHNKLTELPEELNCKELIIMKGNQFSLPTVKGCDLVS